MTQLRFAFRTLFKTPFVTTVAIISLALGIGANAAIFSLFNQILLRPLAVPEANRLVNLGAPGPKPGSTSCSQPGDCEQVFSYLMFRDLEKTQTVFTGIAAHEPFGANLAANHQTENGQGLLMKLAVNISLAVQMLAFSEGLLLAEKGGIDRALAIDVLTQSAVGSPMLKSRAPLVLALPENPLFAIVCAAVSNAPLDAA